MYNLKGQKFGRLTVLERAKAIGPRNGVVVWRCRCDCGNITEVRSDNLLRGTTRSCGCFATERRMRHGEAHPSYKHGGIGTRLYHSWANMKARCYNPNAKSYEYYGGRGIEVCEEWRESFTAFKEWALANGYAENLTIDRINSNGDYCPENCQWLTKSENAQKKWREYRKKHGLPPEPQRPVPRLGA